MKPSAVLFKLRLYFSNCFSVFLFDKYFVRGLFSINSFSQFVVDFKISFVIEYQYLVYIVLLIVYLTFIYVLILN